MKRTILMIAGALALVSSTMSAIAGNPNPVNEKTAEKTDNSTNINIVNSTTVINTVVNYMVKNPAYLVVHSEDPKKAVERWFASLVEEGRTPGDRYVRGLFYDWLRYQRREHEELKRLTGTDSLQNGDPIPVKDDGNYDNTDTVRIYLHDSGYEVSDAQIVNVRSYMMAHGIRHVSELGQ